MKRRDDIEWLRALACFGIVWYHGRGAGLELALSGLIVFVVLSVALGGGRVRPWRERLWSRARRLLLPWAFWFGVFGLALAVTGHAPLRLDHGWLLGILAGPSIHLWYLPFMFMVLMALELWRERSSHQAWLRAAGLCAWLGASLLVLFSLRVISVRDYPYPVAQYLQVAPAVLAGVVLRSWEAWPPQRRWVLVAPLAAGLACLAVLPAIPGVTWAYLIGLPLVAWVLLRPHGVRWSAQGLADCSMGIYLVHPLLLMVLNKCGSMSWGFSPAILFLAAWGGVWTARTWAPHPLVRELF